MDKDCETFTKNSGMITTEEYLIRYVQKYYLILAIALFCLYLASPIRL
jgi:hypothetical protein